jgi:hypothetical protein
MKNFAPHECFGRLVVVDLAERGEHNKPARWNCLCDCGNSVVVRGSALRNHTTRSCGCLQKQHAKQLARTSLAKHGHTARGLKSPEYFSWCAMIQRCTNPKNNRYAIYGGRGISVCSRWTEEKGFDHFLSDMGPRPKGMTLDREETNGNYEPDNCRWATRSTQMKNRRPFSRNRKPDIVAGIQSDGLVVLA